MPQQITDERLMSRALELARQGTALASPNPMVGAVVVDRDGSIAGEGFHTYAGIKHAEIIALEQAGERSRGATLYLNFEPCCHQGRTAPCVDSVIKAGLARVVCAMQDPNPRVSGKGFERLRAAGIEVKAGLLEDEARELNESFARYIRSGLPLVTLKSAMTLDGKIAPAPSESQNPTALGSAGASRGWITSEQARAPVQTLRHQSDALLAGVGTVIADDPLLTDRTGERRRRPLVRVILDSGLRIPLDSRIVSGCKEDVLVFSTRGEQSRRRELESRGVRVEQVRDENGRPDLAAVVKRLGEMEITSVLIEGGSQINGAALSSDMVDKVFFYYAPKIFGRDAVPFAHEGQTPAPLELRLTSIHRFGEDFAIEAYLRDPYTIS